MLAKIGTTNFLLLIVRSHNSSGYGGMYVAAKMEVEVNHFMDMLVDNQR